MTNSMLIVISSIKAYLTNIKLKQYFLFTIGVFFTVVMSYNIRPYLISQHLDTPLNPLTWIVFSILIAIGIVQTIENKKIIYNSFLFIMTFGCILLLIPLFYNSEDAWFSYSRLIGLFAGLSLLFAIQQMQFTKQEFHKILFIILLGVIIQSLIALVQLYLAPHISALSLITGNVPSGVFFQKNIASVFFVTGSFISLFLLQEYKKFPSEKSYLTTSYLILLYLTPLTTTIAVASLQSRTAFLGLFIGLITLLITSNINKKWLVITVLGYIIGSINLPSIQTNESEVIPLQKIGIPIGSIGVRTELYSNTLELIGQKPFLGHGYGTFSKKYLEIQAQKNMTSSSSVVYIAAIWSKPHNEILYWFVEGGLVPLVGLLLFLMAILRVSIRDIKNGSNRMFIFFPIAIHTLTEYPFYHYSVVWLVFLFLLSFLSLSEEIKTYSIKTSLNGNNAIKAIAFSLVIVTFLLMASVLYSQRLAYFAEQTGNNQPILKTTLPLVSPLFERAFNNTKLSNAFKLNNKDAVKEYIVWAEKQNKVVPQAGYHFNLIKGHLFLGNKEQAKQLLAKSLHLYPNKNWNSVIKFVDHHLNKD